MVDLQLLSTPSSAIIDHQSESSSSSSSPPSPTSPLPPDFPIIPHLQYSSPPHTFVNYTDNQLLYFPLPLHYFPTPAPPTPAYYYYLPDYVPSVPNHFYPQSHVVSVDSAAVDGGLPPPASGGGNQNEFWRWRTPRKFNGSGKQYGKELMWKPKEGSRSGHASGPLIRTRPRPPLLPDDLTNCTTVMIKNIPSRISRRELITKLDRHCREQNEKRGYCMSQYDFLYLPIDFKTKMNLGYAFVNFTTMEGASALNTCWTGKGWVASPKIRLITRARLQGIEECKKHFKNAVFYCQSDEYLPLVFSPPRDGSNGDTCKMINVGEWVYWIKVRRIEKFHSSKTISPPRLSR